MPYLVGPKKDVRSTWEVYWGYLPYFLAADLELIKTVDARMKELYAGSEDDPERARFLSKTVIKLILEKYPMKGLKEALTALEAMSPQEVEKSEG